MKWPKYYSKLHQAALLFIPVLSLMVEQWWDFELTKDISYSVEFRYIMDEYNIMLNKIWNGSNL